MRGLTRNLFFIQRYDNGRIGSVHRKFGFAHFGCTHGGGNIVAANKHRRKVCAASRIHNLPVIALRYGDLRIFVAARYCPAYRVGMQTAYGMRRFRCGKRCRGFAVFHRRFHKFAVYRYTVFSLCRNGYFHRYVGKQRRLAVVNRLPVYREDCAVRHGNIGLLRNDRFGKRSKRVILGDRRIKSVRARHISARTVRKFSARKIFRTFYRIVQYTVYIERKYVFLFVVCKQELRIFAIILGNLVFMLIIYTVVSVHKSVRGTACSLICVRRRRKELHRVAVFVFYGNAVARPLIVVRVHFHIEFETAVNRSAAHIVCKHIGRVVRQMRCLNLSALIQRHIFEFERIQRDIFPRIIGRTVKLLVGSIYCNRRNAVLSEHAVERKRIFSVYGYFSSAYRILARTQHREIKHTRRSGRAYNVQ